MQTKQSASADFPKNIALPNGFTLLEMSIVLVIIALVAGSVLAGQAMVRAARIRDLIGQYDMTKQAIKEFQDKYQALPGDMVGATAIWGTDGGGCPPLANTVTKVATCDGDGNGHIGNSDVSANLTATTEWFRAWQHLANAGFIPGRFTGVQGSDTLTNQTLPGINVPSSKIPNSGLIVNYLLNTTTSSTLWGDQYGHVMEVGSYDVTTHYPDGAVLTAGEALDVDSKIDDGLPYSGKVRAWRNGLASNANCTTDDGSTQASQAYTSQNGLNCALLILLGF